MGSETIGKVTAFITRETDSGRQLLVFRHPSAGIQLPAGTMERGETPEIAVLREAHEETGLTDVEIAAHLGTMVERMDGWHLLTDPYTFDSGVKLTRGWPVHVISGEGENDYVCYEFQHDSDGFHDDPAKTGWLPRRLLTTRVRRHLLHLITTAPTLERWTNYEDDEHIFALYWAALDVKLSGWQQAWLDRVRDRLGR